jgi:hypothetical protein
MARLKVTTTKKKSLSYEKEDMSSSRTKCRMKKKSDNEDAEDEASLKSKPPKRKPTMKRKVASKDTEEDSSPRRSSGRAKKVSSKDKKQEPSPRKSSGRKKKAPVDEPVVRYDHHRSPRIMESEKKLGGKMSKAEGKKHQSRHDDSDSESSSEESDSSSSSASSDSHESTDSGDDGDSTSSSSSSSNGSDTLIDEPKKKISLHYMKKLEKHFHSFDDKMKKTDYKSVKQHLVFSSLSRKIKKNKLRRRGQNATLMGVHVQLLVGLCSY